MTVGPLDHVRPAYGRASLAELLPSALAVLGVPAPDPLGLTARLEGVRRIAVLVVDGLGSYQIPLATPHAPTLGDVALAATDLTSVFPSTTPAGLASIGAGAVPGAHGLLAFTVNVPGTDRVLNHTQWWDDPDPLVWQPVPSRLAVARAAGVAVSVVSRPEYAGSGLTAAAWRGGDYRAAPDVDSLVTGMLDGLAADGRALVVGYHPTIDSAGHRFGVDSPEWRAAVSELDGPLARLVEGLPADAALLITADHGQLDVPGEGRYDVDADARLSAGIRVVAGEPRVRYLHTLPGATDDVLAAWREVLGEHAWVAPREEVVEGGWFGRVSDAHLARIGDVVVTSNGLTAVLATAREPETVAKLVAYHGSYTAAEMMVPLIVVRAV
ncbi:alkaline phosphatase family protein [Phytohabitans houttuyneae]|uniref:Alkaline phosphatase family protein n=1 Tax=Phytohabitans houttuyneae TaxID=1076126 RepID=A0A6V8K5A0_9ACTN|nr:nucleotide pyrophosphatase/phosphodiesterase family protein [Phytohabitans houttuyneae]GFJ77581.1 alkaline phosphatase family protein [Phytohabitans houttuyneae]